LAGRVFLLAVFAALVALRIPGVLQGRLWAEDGLFLLDALRLPLVAEMSLRDEQAADAVVYDLGDAADVGGHDGRPGRRRLEVHDAQRLVHRRRHEHGRGGQQLALELGARHAVDPDDT